MAKYVSKDELHKQSEWMYEPKTYCEDYALRHVVKMNTIDSIPDANVVEKEMILDFIEDNRPTDVQTDWERGCAYICDEIEKLLK